MFRVTWASISLIFFCCSGAKFIVEGLVSKIIPQLVIVRDHGLIICSEGNDFNFA